MQPPAPRNHCRLCGAASYARLVHRNADGTMGYSGLYRCSGCTATFTDPADWRAPPSEVNRPAVVPGDRRSAGIAAESARSGSEPD